MKNTKANNHHQDFVEIFRPFITVKGERVYPPPPLKAFRLLIPKDKYRG